MDRLAELWDGKPDEKKKGKGKKHGNRQEGQGTVTISQPISQAMTQSLYGGGGGVSANTGSDNYSTSISQLPTSMPTSQPTQSMPKYNDNYQMPGVNVPAYEMSEPMAANDVLGGAFGSNF